MRCMCGDLTFQPVDAIVNAANGKGWMGGFLGRYMKFRGVAESIHFASKGQIENEAKGFVYWSHPKPRPGDVYITGAGPLPAKCVIHAVTVDRPGSRSDIQVVAKCLENIVRLARQRHIRSLAIPLLGTGTGKLSKIEVWHLYETFFEDVTDIEIVVVLPTHKR